MKTTRLRIAATASIFALCSTSVFGDQPYGQDFESDHAGVIERQFPGDASNLFRTASGGGNLGVASHQGNFHLEVGLISEAFETGFGYGASWNDTTAAGSFVSGSAAGFSVYIDDPARQADWGAGLEDLYWEGDGFWFEPTLLHAAGGSAISNGGFGVRLDGGAWQVAATGSATGGFDYGLNNGSHPESGQTTFLGSATATLSEGWYTFETSWIANGTGGIDQVNTILDGAGIPIYMATVVNAIGDINDAGLLGSAWVGQDGPRPGESTYTGNAVPDSFMGDLAIDGVYAIPEPSTYAAIFGLFALGLAGVIRRKRNAAK